MRIEPLGNGLINDTFKVMTPGTQEKQYVLQKINTSIFTDVDMLQNNIDIVTKHIRAKLLEKKESDIDRKVLHFLKTDSGKSYYRDGDNCWRLSVYIADSITLEKTDCKSSYDTGIAFGQFESMLSDLKKPIGETIPNFHNMEFRLQQLQDAILQDKAGRKAGVQYYIDSLFSDSDEMCSAEQLFRKGKLPKRICHCDTKVNNILFDKGGNILCVIDLDTVMPSFIFSDYGDFLRTAANTGKEDDENLENISFRMDIFKSFTEGYLKGAGGFLTKTEISMLPFATKLFPYMQCVRFLTDYINGDTYYKTTYPEHNLVRTKAQYKLYECIKKKREEMACTISSLIKQ